MKRIMTTYCLLVALFFYCGDLACYAADTDHACHLSTGVQSADEACGASMDLAPEGMILPALLSVILLHLYTADSIAVQHPIPASFVHRPDPHIRALEPPRGPPVASMLTIL